MGVGKSFDLMTGNEYNHAYIFSDGKIMDLNSLIDPASGWNLELATDINDNGQIVGTGIVGGMHHAYLLTPVPIPAAFWLFSCGLAVLTAIARRRDTTR